MTPPLSQDAAGGSAFPVFPSPPPAYPSYVDDSTLPPLAVPLGYGSGPMPMPPPPYESVPIAQPVYRQQHYQAGSVAVYRDPRLETQGAAPGNAGSSTPLVQFEYDLSPNPPQQQQMHRPRGSHRAYHQMYQDQQQQQRLVQPYRPPSKCAGVVYLLKLFVFNALNGVLGMAGFAVVNVGLCMSLTALPLCCFGVVLFRVLLRVVYYGCKVDAVLHNLIASSDDKIQFGSHHHHYYHHRGSSARAERHSLLPTQVDWQLQPHHQEDNDQLPQFEKSLEEISPRAMLATIYFGSIKFLVGIFSMISIGLMVLVLAFFLDNEEVKLEIDADDSDDPFTDYMFALGLAVFSVALLFANARISQAITRFFCCEGGV